MMRVVLDTNVLVRAAANEEGLAGRLFRRTPQTGAVAAGSRIFKPEKQAR